MKQTIIAKNGNYRISAASCCERPLSVLKIEGTHDYKMVHNLQVVAVHPWFSARAHILQEALDILRREEIVSSEEYTNASLNIMKAAQRFSVN